MTLSIVFVIGGLLALAAWWTVDKTAERTARERPKKDDAAQRARAWHPPELPANWEKVYAVVGTTTMVLNRTNTTLIPFRFEAGGDTNDPVIIEVRKNRVHVKAELGTERGEKIVFKDGQIFGLPPNWDKQPHSDPSAGAFEVVDEKGRPRLQIYYRHSTHLVVNGLFIVGQSYVAAFNNGLGQGHISPKEFPFIDEKPIYKYPAFQFPNQLAERPEASIVKPRPLSEIRKEALSIGLELSALADEWVKKGYTPSQQVQVSVHAEMVSVYRAQFMDRVIIIHRELEVLGFKLFEYPEMLRNPNGASLHHIAESLIEEGSKQ